MLCTEVFGPGAAGLWLLAPRVPSERVSRPCRRVVEEVVDALKQPGASREAAIVQEQLRGEGPCKACFQWSLPLRCLL